MRLSTIHAARALALLGLVGALLLATTAARAADGPTPAGGAGPASLTIPLGNDTAPEGEDCPDFNGPFWHFVITPNNDESYFITFHLNLGDAATYDTSVYVPNGEQLDNVFVAVPAGKELTSLVKSGSTADISWSGDGPEPGTFKLSHICLDPPAAQDLTVEKTAAPAYTRTYGWEIEKSADTSVVYSAGGGESGPVNYTVAVTRDEGTDADWAVTGEITVANPNAFAVDGVSLADAAPDGDCAVTPATVDVPAEGTASADYTCTFASNPGSGTNTVTATWADIGSPSTSATGTADFAFGDPTSVVNESVDVVDTNGGSWTFTGTDSVTYAMTYTDPAGTCTSHENTATITQTDQSASATVTDCQGADPTIEKTATPAYDLTYAWSIDKAADPTSQTVDAGYPATFAYAVEVSHDAGTESNWAVAGEIEVANPNDWQDLEVDVTDALPDGDCAVEGGTEVMVPMGESVTLAYACTFAANPGSGTNTATATWDAEAFHTPNGTASATAAFEFGDPTNVYDECVAVDDTVAGALGDVCVGDDNPRTFEYTASFTGPAAGTCADQPNTATTTANDSGATESAEASVEVCSYQARLTPGYWKNHLAFDAKNPSNPWVAEYLPQTLGDYAVSTTARATAVWKAMNCSNTGTNAQLNQNAIGCLAGHLLAAKLNVANGANPCIVPTITAADAFLAGIPYTGPTGTYTGIGTAKRATAISLKTALDAYDNGNGCH